MEQARADGLGGAEGASTPSLADSPLPKKAPFGSLQEAMLNKFLDRVFLSEGAEGMEHSGSGVSSSVGSEKPTFSVALMSTNFRRFNARIGAVFAFQKIVERLLLWRHPTHTLSLLAVYTLLVLDPTLLSVAPLGICIFYIMIPAFLARHPPPPVPLADDLDYSLSGPPLAPAPRIKPVPELSKDFFRNMADLQNTMADFANIHDAAVENIGPLTNFSNERLSTVLLIGLLSASFVLFIASHLIPFRLIFLVVGWVAILAGHPQVQALIARLQGQADSSDQTENGLSQIQAFADGDVLLETTQSRREVEIFELQNRAMHKPNSEWQSFMFTIQPFTPMSAARIGGSRPQGTRFFEDVLPPRGWRWADKKWTLDLLSKEWVEERCITGVEIEVEGERWVSDVLYDDLDTEGGEGNNSELRLKPKIKVNEKVVTWEEGFGGQRPLGEWRRRRWFRVVERVEDRRPRADTIVASDD